MYFDFTNNSDEATSFWWACTPYAYQDGVGLAETWAMDTVSEEDNYYTDVEPGESLRCSETWTIRSDSPIEIEVAADLDLQGLLQLESNQVLGIEFLNNLEGTIRTCRSTADKTAILSCLRSNLTSELQPWEGDLPDTQYMLRVIAADGNQLTVGYSANGTVGCLEVGGKPYVAGVMDMETLWGSLKAGMMSQAAAASGKNYLEMSNEFPGEDWGTEFTYGYLKSLDQSVSYDEMRWIVDAEAPNGYVVEAGWPDQEAELSETCEFWILEDHQAPYCRVTAEELLKRDQDAETDVLYRIYTSEGKVIAICEQYAP